MSAPPDAGQAGGPVAERRVCSVLFCDVVGFTPVAAEGDAERAVRAALDLVGAVADLGAVVRAKAARS